MSAKRFFAVLLTIGILVATGVFIARVSIGPTYAGPSDCSNAH
jgi:hypothetical protein